MFTNDAKLGLHHNAVHSEKPFECTQCGEKGSGVQKFKNHMEIVENLVSLIKDVVGMSLPVPNMGIYHHKIQKTKCTECHISIAATSIPRHMKTVHGAQIGKQIKCDECGKCLQTKDRLLQHQKSHSLNPADKDYSCDHCKYKTDFKAYLDHHKKRIHMSQPGLWMCMTGTCRGKPSSFINHHQLKKHQQIECPECKKSFGAKRNMKRHVKNVHKGHNDTSRNSNGSNVDGNLNTDPLLPSM